ncbi:hypothetical protein ACFL0V_03780 [Nanoarchaeota archaeon]
MENSLQKLGRQAIGEIGEALAQKVIGYCVRPCNISRYGFFKRYPGIDSDIRTFLRTYWYNFDLIKFCENKLQLIEVKTTTKNYNFRGKKQLCLTPVTKKMYYEAKKLGIEVLFLHIRISERWNFHHDLIVLDNDYFSISGGGVNRNKPKWVERYVKNRYSKR